VIEITNEPSAEDPVAGDLDDLPGVAAAPERDDNVSDAPTPDDRDALGSELRLTVLDRRGRLVALVATAVVSVAAAVAALMTNGTVPAAVPAPQPPPAEVVAPEGEILAPIGPAAPAHFLPLAEVSGVPEGRQIWLVNRPYSNGNYYPQDRPCTRESDGRVSCAEYFLGNGPEDAGKVYDLLLVAADADAVNAFLRYDVEHGDAFLGMPALPAGVTVLDRVTVTRE
jgi:hypothetical protein